MISYGEAIAQCAEHIARDDSHGYSQPNRKGYGTENLAFSDGTKYTIHHGDYDCSEMARQCAESAGLLSRDSYMWTGNEHDVLLNAGFRLVPLSEKIRGDILWKPGHTGIYLGNGMMADAHGDERGGITGPTQGDQTGREIEIRPVSLCSWDRCFRPPMGYLGVSQTVPSIHDGIDVSNHDIDEPVAGVDCGFMIAKVSEGTYFKDKYCSTFLDIARDKGILYGMYHFAGTGDARAEADYFVNCARETGYIDNATLWLDYEQDALTNGPEWAETFMRRVDELTGKTCGIYMSQSVTIAQDWSRSAHRPLWVAQYADMDETSWQSDPWSTWVFGAWDATCAIHQYTCMGVVGECTCIDLDRGYFTAEQWNSWANSTTDEPSIKPGTDTSGDYFKMKEKTVTFHDTVNVRTAPSTHADIVSQYHKGEFVTIDGVAIEDGYSWGHYIGAASNKDRYVALGKTDYIN